MKIAPAYTATQPQPIDAGTRGAPSIRLGQPGRYQRARIARFRSFLGVRSGFPIADELLVVAPWRNREDIAAVAQISAVRRLDDLIHSARDASFRLGAHAFVMPEWNETRSPRFYERNGLRNVRGCCLVRDRNRRRRARTICDSGNPVRSWSPSTRCCSIRFLPSITRLFPGFGVILGSSSSTTSLPRASRSGRCGIQRANQSDMSASPAMQDGVIWTELPSRPRVRVRDTAQPRFDSRLRGCGNLERGGSGLSTQLSNLRSQQLYARIGFQQTRQNDYRIYGTLAPDAPIGGAERA